MNVGVFTVVFAVLLAVPLGARGAIPRRLPGAHRLERRLAAGDRRLPLDGRRNISAAGRLRFIAALRLSRSTHDVAIP